MNQASLDQIVDAAEATLTHAMTDDKMSGVTGVALNACAKELAAALSPGDRVGPCVAVLIDRGGDKPDPGMVAVTQDRLLVAWWQGLFRPKATVHAVPLGEVTRVTHSQRKARSLSPMSAAVTLDAGGEQYTFIFYSAWMSESVAHEIADLLDGPAAFPAAAD